LCGPGIGIIYGASNNDSKSIFNQFSLPLSSVPLRFIFDDFENVKSIIQRGMYDEATIAESLALKDLCYLRDGLMFLNFEITSEVLLCAFNHFTI
jgi:hypothetical protein